ncbi:MAG: acyl-CoA dehydrogenase family protein [Candidatus Thiodiazotropha sp.]
MNRDTLNSPTGMLRQTLGESGDETQLRDYEHWWAQQGRAISEAVDRAGTPWLRMFDRKGRRIDEIQFESGYRQLLERGYREGVIWQCFEQDDLLPFYRLGYVTSFFDPGLYCPYTVSMATAVALHKYGDDSLRSDYLHHLLQRDAGVWQGATWMTEIGGGSDLGRTVRTRADPAGTHWLLNGDKYFASNVGAELAIVAARPRGAPEAVRGLALYLVPRERSDGSLNYTVRRLKNKIGTRSVPTGEVELRDTEGYLLGRAEAGIYLILEGLNISRVANSVACVALAQRALSEAADFAASREVFGRPLLQQPLFERQFETHLRGLRENFMLAWESVRLLREVWREQPAYSARYHLFRLVAHLAKYLTAEFALETSQWAMQAHGALGVLAEFPIERCFREAMILAIWEGTSHRQILDGFEVMQRKQAHELLFEHLGGAAEPAAVERLRGEIERLLKLDQTAREAQAEGVFRQLAGFTARSLVERPE